MSVTPEELARAAEAIQRIVSRNVMVGVLNDKTALEGARATASVLRPKGSYLLTAEQYAAPWACLKCGEEMPDHADDCPFQRQETP